MRMACVRNVRALIHIQTSSSHIAQRPGISREGTQRMAGERLGTINTSAASGALHLARLSQRVQQIGFALETTAWAGWKGSYAMRCPAGHHFKASATLLLHRPIHCPCCEAGSFIQRLQLLAAQKSGKYLGPCTHDPHQHRFECAEGHTWQLVAQRALAGVWCAKCAYRPEQKASLYVKGLRRLQLFAEHRRGVCLATEYTRARSTYSFKCARGHVWEASGQAVLAKGEWCPECEGLVGSACE